jgi:transposase
MPDAAWAVSGHPRQQTQVINALRAHLAELGIVAAQGPEGLKQLLAIIADEKDARLSIDARASLIVLAAQLQALHTMIGSIEKRLVVQHRANEASKRLQSIHGIGIIGASAIAATVTDPKAFRSGRDFAAWYLRPVPSLYYNCCLGNSDRGVP